MKYQLSTAALENQKTACLVLAVFDRRTLSTPAEAVDQLCDGGLKAALASGDMDGRMGQTLVLRGLPNLLAERVLLVGCGKKSGFDARKFRGAVQATAVTLGQLGAKDAVLSLPLLECQGLDEPARLQQAVLNLESSWYRFEELKAEKKPKRALKKLTLAASSKAKAMSQALAQAEATAAGVSLARDLGNRPGNLCTPTDLASLAESLADEYKSIQTKVLEESEMEKLGMGALLSVSRGSRQPAKLIIMSYNGGKKKDKPVALVGKGLTFDAGGISLKPAARMEEMKFDMCGAAGVFGAIKAAAELKLPINVLGVVPSSENLPDGAANKPGDVVRSMAGITIEVINTDAEGRLILCDALTYTQQEYEPEAIIDMATLTGACVVALGNQATGLFANDQVLADALLAAGQTSGDRAWQMPLWEEYQQQLRSPVADVANVGGAGAGAITAASFLHRFTRKAKWAHLDIAGTAWTEKKLGTGRPVPLLMQYLIDRSGA